MLTDEHRLPHLIGHFEQFDDDAVVRAARMVALLRDRRLGPDGVADEHRLDEAQAIVTGGYRAGIDVRRRHPDADAEDECAVRHAPFEVLRRAPLGVHVVGKEVAGLAGVGDDGCSSFSTIAACPPSRIARSTPGARRSPKSRKGRMSRVSGVVAYADPASWTVDDIRPYVEHAIASFGWDRVVWGSDWPVCTLTASLSIWVAATHTITFGCAPSERERLFSLNARRIWRLPN